VRVVLIHGSVGNAEAWAPVRPALEERFEVAAPNRGGYPPGPPLERIDFERQAEELAPLLGDGAHLVGHSYGGVVSLLAAAQRPAAVRSLILIEPPAFGVARGDPAVEEMIANIETAARSTHDPSEYRAAFLRGFGFPARATPLSGRTLEAARASMTERPPWEAQIPLDDLARARLRVLLVQGDWCPAPDSARALAGAAFRAVCERLDDRLEPERAILPAAHAPQKLGSIFNNRIREFWESA
jgi:pimeloyl-ACP methyl ester carboxylesterase